jgi:bile acid-coenzyme A ligase
MTNVPMPAALAIAARANPDAPAVTVDDETLSRAELLARAYGFAQAFSSRGVKEGDIVSVLLPNSLDFVAASIGALMVAATPQPLSNRLAAAERAAILDLSAPAVVVVGEDPPELDFPLLRTDEVESGEVGADLPAAFLEAVAPSWKAPTSGGSSGRPKVIVSADTAVIDPDDENVFKLTRLPTDSAVVVPGPLYHNGPFLFGMYALLRRNHVVFSSRFDPERTLAQVQRHRATFLYSVPTMMSRISRLSPEQLDAFDLSSLETMIHMASACPRALKEEWMERLGDEVVYELYSGTEGQAVMMISGVEWRQHPGSVGRPMAGELKVVGEDGVDLPTREVGVIYLRRDPEGTRTYRYLGAEAKRIEGGWESLGDVGWLDEEGYLYLADKRSDLILRGGVNIYPAEVEAAIEEHPVVLEAVVVGLPDDDLGQRVHAIIRLEGDLSFEQLIAHLGERLSRYKLPATCEFVSEPLREDSGKVRRSSLGAQRS